MSINIKNLTKIYGQQKAVDNISFQVKEGEIVGFLGPNGAGKSTTMKIATCYLPPSSGSVEICGLDVVENSIEVRKRIGYLPEHNPLYLDMYLHEYLKFIGRIYKIKGKELSHRISEMIELCGLTREQNKQIGALSKGYRQRVGLAQSLLHDPEVLIMDEPTTGLDPNQIIEIRSLIKGISENKTVLFSTHIMQEVQALCDRVVVIDKGVIVADDKIETLMNSSEIIIKAEFESKIEESILRNLQGVVGISNEGLIYYLQVDSDIRSEIFKQAAEKNLPLLSLNIQEQSIEGIFRELTSKKSVNG